MQLHIGPINAAVPTPLHPDKQLDESSLCKLYAHCRCIGLDGVFLLASMGEGHLLPDRARERVVELARAELTRSVAILACASDVSAVRMHERAQRYAARGADCVVFTIPQNVSIDQGIDELHHVAASCTVPCGYYEVPARTGRALSFSQLQRLLSHPNVCILKDSSNNVLYAQAIGDGALRSANVTILDGVEFRTAFSAALGYDGVLHGGGALTARRVRRIWQLVKEGNLTEALALDRKNSLFLAGIYDRFLSTSRAAIGQKYALKLLGIFDHETVLLDQELDEDARKRIEETLGRHKSELFETPES